MDDFPRLTIIIPVYNVEHYLCECLDSVLQQTYRNIEIILINDGSTDNSGEICNKYSSNFSNIILFHQSNHGQSVARNRGLENATGEYVLFVDSDDWLTKNACENLIKTALATGADIVHGDFIDSDSELAKRNQYAGKLMRAPDYIKIGLKTWTYDVVPVLNLIRLKILLDSKIFFPVGYYYEDHAYSYALYSLASASFFKIKLPFYYYRSNPSSTTKTFSSKKATDICDVISIMSNAYDDGHARMFGPIVVTLVQLSYVFSKLDYESSKSVLKNIPKRLFFKTIFAKEIRLSVRLRVAVFLLSPAFYRITIKSLK